MEPDNQLFVNIYIYINIYIYNFYLKKEEASFKKEERLRKIINIELFCYH